MNSIRFDENTQYFIKEEDLYYSGTQGRLIKLLRDLQF